MSRDDAVVCPDCGRRLRYEDIDEVYYCPDPCCGYEVTCYYGEDE